MIQINKIIEQTIENEIYLENKDFYVWNHWLKEWFETRDWKKIMDETIGWKQYASHTTNLIEDAVNSIIMLTSWKWNWKFYVEENFIIEEIIKDLKLEEKNDLIIKNMLLTWNWYLHFFTDKLGKPFVEVLWNDNVYVRREYWIIVEAAIVEEIKIWEKIETKITYFDEKEKIAEIYIGWNRTDKSEYKTLPIVSFWNWTPYITRNLKGINSEINILNSWIKEQMKFTSFPIFVIKGVDEIWGRINLSPSQVIRLESEKSSIEKIEGSDIWDNLLKRIKEFEKHFYKAAKISALKSDANEKWNEKSWVSKKIELIETETKIQEIRWFLKKGYEEFFKTLYGINESLIKFYPTLMSNDFEYDKKSEDLKIKKEELEILKGFLSLGFSKTESLELLNK